MSKKKKEKNQTEKPKKNDLSEFYKKNYKKFLIIPLLFLIFAGFSIYYTIQDDGTPINRDISLKGGLSAVITIDTPKSAQEITNALQSNFPDYSYSVSETFQAGQRSGFIIDTDLAEDDFKPFMENLLGTNLEFGENYGSNFISPTLSNTFFTQAILILLISFVLISLVIFIYFREIIPSLALIISIAFDLVVTVGVLNFMGVTISIAGIGALLMIIGYSIDTDVLLANRLLKEFGFDYFEKAYGAFKTGMIMTGTTLVAGFAALILTNSVIIKEIVTIMIVGLLVDAISTWIQNTSILLWWLEKKNAK